MIAQSPSRSSAVLNQPFDGETCRPEPPDASWQHRFLRLLPAIRRYAEIRFRNLPSELRAELVQETVARALFGYVRLVERDKEHLACATPLARFAAAQIHAGRRIGRKRNVRDVSSRYCRARKGVTLESLDSQYGTSGDWREIVVEDRQAGPAEVAAMRIDFAQWLSTLPSRSRRIAKRLATGETTSDTARHFGISPSRVSQLRRELHRAWLAFQGEPAPAEAVLAKALR